MRCRRILHIWVLTADSCELRKQGDAPARPEALASTRRSPSLMEPTPLSSNQKAPARVACKASISFCPALPCFLLAGFKPPGANESECRRGARPQLRARPCESNCRGEVIMVRQGLAAAAGECTGTAGLRRLSPRRLPSALPASMFPPGRLRPRGDRCPGGGKTGVPAGTGPAPALQGRHCPLVR